MADQGVFRFDMLLPPEMAELATGAGTKKVQMDFFSTFILGILAGSFIGLGANFYTIVMTGTAGSLPFGLAKMLGGLAFCLGLILVVVAGAELFTGNSLIVMAVASRKVGLRQLLRNWLIVYIGNFIGSILLAGAVWRSGQGDSADGAVGALALKIANDKCALVFWEAFLRGVLCNTLVCLALWLCLSARTTLDRIAAIVFPVTAFVACGFEHCVANMYFVPLGLLLKSGDLDAHFTMLQLTWSNFFVRNLIPVTLGNMVGGGGLVGFIFWVIYCRRKPSYRDEVK